LLGAGVTGSARAVQVCAALITIIFLATYAAAQFTAGSKALEVILGWDRFTSAALGAAIVLLYCFAGGVRASIWTNVAQSFVMLGAMIMLLWTALSAVGGPQALWQKLHAIDPDLVNPVPAGLRFGFPLYLAGWLLAGVGVVGQPHVMLAVLTAREGKDLDKARHIYFGWYVFFSAAALGVALCCRVLIPQTATFDPELALPILAAQRLPAALVGLVLAGLFAAAMSTADSQLLSCSGAVTQDLFGDWRESYWASKITTAVWTGFALALALNLNQTVFSLVALSWSALAVTIGPVLAAVVFRRPLTGSTAIGIMVSALIAVVAWRFLLGYSAHVYEVLPGMLAALLVFTIARGRSARAREVQAARDRDSSAAD
jgi:sodium/proline symporter